MTESHDTSARPQAVPVGHTTVLADVRSVLAVSLLGIGLVAGCRVDRAADELGMDLGPRNAARTAPAPGEAALLLERTAAAAPVVSDHFFGGMPAAAGDGWVVLVNEGYVSCYDEQARTPRWVCYRLFEVETPTMGRPDDDDFITDTRVTPQVSHSDYTNSGYDRGHNAPSSAIGARYGADAQLETYLTTNATPQAPNLNQRVWERFEDRVSTDYAQRLGEVWVVTGPIFEGAPFELPSEVRVPSRYFKVVVAEDASGFVHMLAVIMPQNASDGRPVADFVTTVDEIEALTGIDFFTDLPDVVEDAAESSPPDEGVWETQRVLSPSFPGTPRTLKVRYVLDRG